MAHSLAFGAWRDSYSGKNGISILNAPMDDTFMKLSKIGVTVKNADIFV